MTKRWSLGLDFFSNPICSLHLMFSFAVHFSSLSFIIIRSARQKQEEAARNKRINRMLIAMVIIFGTSWFPINLINLVADSVDLGIGKVLLNSDFHHIIRLLAPLLPLLLHLPHRGHVLHLL